MSAYIFNGTAYAADREKQLAQQVSRLNKTPRIGSVLFVEDKASHLYTRLKMEAALRAGIEFTLEEVSMRESLTNLQEKVYNFSRRTDLDGVLIQKPMKTSWYELFGKDSSGYNIWWESLVSQLLSEKDVDCLTRTNLDKVYQGKWTVLPATVKAVWTIIQSIPTSIHQLADAQGNLNLANVPAVVLGRSELVGIPAASLLKQYGANVHIYGSDLDVEVLCQADLIVSATGKRNLVTGDMVKQDAMIIDVGAPGPDVEFASVAPKASFLTPVPEGVGPMTVVSLLENLVELVRS